MFDYSKLLGKVVETYGTQQSFSLALGMSQRSLSEKLNNKRTWKQSDIVKSAKLLGISNSEIGIYFFKTKVQ
ncbi:repressor [Lactococcus lactis]|uniref:DUF739 family protein n=1 Tax=Lactococcus lactis TaxID=1358 RepID=UPI00076078F3|nr:DUF739 family protein [Lactococcus lactis]KWT48851.1 repressor [Lactococcus lactis]